MKNKLQLTNFRHLIGLLAALLSLLFVSQSAWAYYQIRGTMNSWNCWEMNSNNQYLVYSTGTSFDFKICDGCSWTTAYSTGGSVGATPSGTLLETNKGNSTWGTITNGAIYGWTFDNNHKLYISKISLQMYDPGKKADVYLGDYVSTSDYWVYYLICFSNFGGAKVAFFNSTSSVTDVDAEWYEDDGNNRKYKANLKNKQFTSTGNWYAKGAVSATNDNTKYAYSNNSTNAAAEGTTTLSANTNGAVYWNVQALPNATAQTATAASSSQIDLAWTKNATKTTVMIVRYLNSASVTAPTNGTSYSVGGTIGAGTVIYKGTGATKSDTGLSENTKYKYYFYTVNNNYYSSGVNASATTCFTPSTPTIGTLTYTSCTAITVGMTGRTANYFMLVKYEGANVTPTKPTDGHVYKVGDTIGDGVVVDVDDNGSQKSGIVIEETKKYTFALYQYYSNCHYYSLPSTKSSGMSTPEVTTAAATGVAAGVATLGGTYVAQGMGAGIEGHGIEWTETVGDKTAGTRVSFGTSVAVGASFSQQISFSTGGTYKYKAYVYSNSGGTCAYGYGAEQSVTVPAACTTPTALNFTYTASRNYNGSALSANVVWTGITGGTITTYYKVKGAGDNTYTTTAPTNAGTYTLAVTSLSSETVCAVTEKLQLNGDYKINKIDQAGLSIAEISAKCMSDSPLQIQATGGSGDGAITYAIIADGTTGTATITSSANKGTLTVTAPGIIKVQATKAASTNYNAATSNIVPITFNGVSVTQSPTTELYPYKPITFTASGSASWTLTTASETAYISTASGTNTVLKAAVGTYTVTATASECATQKSVTVVADPDNCQ